MRVISGRWFSCALFSLLGVVCTFNAPAAAANTLCTRIIQSGEYPIPMEERESDRQVQARVLPDFIARGDQLVDEGNLAEAVDAYDRVFGGFQYRGVFFGGGRCLSKEFYQEAADKLRAAANALAKNLTAKNNQHDEPDDPGGSQVGALRLYLTSNQYDRFVEQAIAYAESELRQHDIDRALVGLVGNRLDALKRMRTEGRNQQYDNDLTPLLDEELAAFDKLDGFEEKLIAHLKPLYPSVTDYWLAEEARFHQQLLAADGLILKMMLHGKARNRLENGLERLEDHPAELARLKSRANQRGDAFMADGRFEMAEDYFDLAGNAGGRARARYLAGQHDEERFAELAKSVESDVRQMQKSPEEKADFEKETEDMAAEFGFDLDEQ